VADDEGRKKVKVVFLLFWFSSKTASKPHSQPKPSTIPISQARIDGLFFLL